MQRGEIWTLSETETVILVASDRLHGNQFPITYGLPLHAEPAQGLEYPFVVRLTPASTGLAADNWVHTYAIRVIKVDWLVRRFGAVDGASTTAIDDALRALLDL